VVGFEESIMLLAEREESLVYSSGESWTLSLEGLRLTAFTTTGSRPLKCGEDIDYVSHAFKE
jgi:hypothetical protein